MRGKKVAVVDDDEDVVDFYAFILRKAGYEVESARNGDEGIALVRRMHPDVVVLDMMMPDCDGLRFLEALESEIPDASNRPAVVANSGFHRFEDEAKRCGAAAFLRKPVDMEDLVATVEAVLLGAELSQEQLAKRGRHESLSRQRCDAEREALLAHVDLNARELKDRFESVVGWCARYFDVGMALLTLLKAGKLHVHASCGPGSAAATDAEVAHKLTFCEDVVGAGSSLVLGDAADHVVYKSHPAAHNGYRFYAGAPVRTRGGITLGSLCLVDRRSREFHSEDLVIVEHVALRIARKLEAIAGNLGDENFVFDEPGLFTRDMMQLLFAAELRRAGRLGDGLLEFGLVDVAADSDERLAACVRAVDKRVDCHRFSLSRFHRGVLALLRGADEPATVRACLDDAIAALDGVTPVRGVGIVSYPAELSAMAEQQLEMIADEARVRAVSAGGGVERVSISASTRTPTQANAP